MIQQGNIQQLPGFQHRPGEGQIFLAWRQVSAGMVMNQDDGQCFTADGFLKQFTPPHLRAVGRSLLPAVHVDEPVFITQYQHPELRFCQPAQFI